MADASTGGSGRKLATGVVLIAIGAAAAVGLYRASEPDRTPEPVATADSPPRAQPPAPGLEPSETLSSPAPSTVLGRGDLLAAAGAAASSYGAGTGPGPTTTGILGRRFVLRLPFGCEGPAAVETGGAASYALSSDGETLRVTLRPEVWTASPFAQSLADGEVESVEGFWIPRPWLASEDCPAQRTDPLLAAPAQPSPQTVGLATVFTAESSRLARRDGRAYELALPLDETARPGPRGLRLVLEGRVTGFPGGRAVACRSAGPDQRPVCLIGAEVERVAVADPANGSVLGEWRQTAPVNPPGFARPPSPPASAAAAPAG